MSELSRVILILGGFGLPQRLFNDSKGINMGKSAITWTKSTFCADSTCLEATPLGDGTIGVRDNKCPEQPFLIFSSREWHAFLDAVASGQLSPR
jgi:hypothetical protein